MPKKVVKKKVKKAPYHQSQHHHHATNNMLLILAGGFIVLVGLMYLVASTSIMNKGIQTTEATEETLVSNRTVIIERGLFTPETLVIKKGEAVTFENNDAVMHTATALDGSFITQNLDEDTSETIVFDTPGQYEYQCKFHPEMRGKIIVQE